MNRIFISYRRADAIGEAGRLYDSHVGEFGKDGVVMDVDTIEFGQNIRDVISYAVQSAGAVLVLIGNQWLHIADGQGQRRLDNPDDFVRIEVAQALANPEIRVIPVLIQGASVPRYDELPHDLRHLARPNAVSLTHEN